MGQFWVDGFSPAARGFWHRVVSTLTTRGERAAAAIQLLSARNVTGKFEIWHEEKM